MQQQLIDYGKKRTERAKQQAAQPQATAQQDFDQLETEIAQTKGLVEEISEVGIDCLQMGRFWYCRYKMADDSWMVL